MAVIRLPSLVIANGAVVSNYIGGYLFDNGAKITIMAPASLAGAITVEVADTEPGDAVDADFRKLQSSGADVVCTVGDATPITMVAFRSLRLATAVAPGAGGETFDVVLEEKNVSLYG